MAVRVEHHVLAGEKLAAQIFVAALLVVTFAQVVFRYLLHLPLPWSEELARYLFIWVAFIGAAIGVAARDHFGIEFIIERISGWPKVFIEVFSYVASLTFICVLLVYGTVVVLETRHSAMALPVSMQWFYAAIPVGAALMLLHVLVHIINRICLNRVPQSTGP
ncbi:MAG: TRAP transporter small permease [Parvibaculaceae bacterium]